MTNEAEIKKWLSGYTRDWDQLCQALMWRLCERFGSVPRDGIGSAYEAYMYELANNRINTGPIPADGGVFVYFDIGTDDHVGFVMNGGRVLMATKHLAESWVTRDAGWQTVAEYVRLTGARVYGWSYRNAGNTVPWTPNITPPPSIPASGFAVAPGGEANAPHWPVGALMTRLQKALSKRGRYNYDNGSARPADGVGGHYTALGIQKTLNHSGRNGGVLAADFTLVSPLDGKLGRNNALGVQEYAMDFGGGPNIHDGDPRTNGWTAFAIGLETD